MQLLTVDLWEPHLASGPSQASSAPSPRRILVGDRSDEPMGFLTVDKRS